MDWKGSPASSASRVPCVEGRNGASTMRGSGPKLACPHLAPAHNTTSEQRRRGGTRQAMCDPTLECAGRGKIDCSG